MLASAVWVAFDRRFSGLTPRTGREICGLGKASGRAAITNFQPLGGNKLGANNLLIKVISA